jgi:hypothetical protein
MRKNKCWTLSLVAEVASSRRKSLSAAFSISSRNFATAEPITTAVEREEAVAMNLFFENLRGDDETPLVAEYIEETAVAVCLDEQLQQALGEDGDNDLCGPILPTILLSKRNTSALLTTKILNLICKLCRRELAKSTSNYQNIAKLSAHGVCEAIVVKLKEYCEDEKVMEAACWCIMVLASDNQDNQVLLANEGGCDLVLTALNHFAGNLDIIEIICRALRNLSSNLSIAAYCIAEGVGDPITGTIVIHTAHPIQLEAALWVVVNLACQTDNATVLGSSGICVAITDALRVNLSNEGVVTAACWALRNLSCGSGFNYVQFSHTDVCLSLVQILSSLSHIVSDDLSFSSCVVPALWAISNLTCDNQISEQFGQVEGSCSILVTIFRSYFLQLSNLLTIPEFQHLVTEYLNVLDAALWALRNAATGGIHCHTQLVSEGLVDALTSMLECEWLADLSPSHLSTGCGVIVNLLSVEYDTVILAPLLAPSTPIPPVSHIGTIPLCELLCNLMRRFPETREIQETVCRSFRLLTRIHMSAPDTQQQFVSFFLAAGVCRLTALALKNHSDSSSSAPSSSDLTRNACELLFLLHFDSHPEDLQLAEGIAKAIDDASLQGKEGNGAAGEESAALHEPIKRGAYDVTAKRVILRPHDEMVRIWTPEAICRREGWA